MNRRRVLLAGAAGLVLPGRALSQPAARKYRVLVLHSAPVPSGPYHDALRERLAAHGFVEGKNLVLDVPVISTTGFYLQQELRKRLAQKPDAILAFTSMLGDAAITEAPKVPLVFAWVADPVKAGFAKDYARPGGNATGVTNRFVDVALKRLEVLREVAPGVKKIAVAGPTFQPEVESAMAALRDAALHLGIQLVEVSTSVLGQLLEIQRAIRNGAQAVLPLQVYSASGARAAGEEIVRLCAAHRLPAIFAESELVEAGALLSYGTSLVDEVRRATAILANVLRGSRPGDIPIDQSSQFELAVNLKTAREIKVRIPPTVLARANRVIE